MFVAGQGAVDLGFQVNQTVYPSAAFGALMPVNVTPDSAA
jgi:hypothetical protein